MLRKLLRLVFYFITCITFYLNLFFIIFFLKLQLADSIKKRANTTKNTARDLRHEADQLNGRLAKTENSLAEREANIRKDFNLTKEAKEKVGQAQLNSNEAKSQVEKAMKEVKAIIDELADLRDIDIKSLNALGMQFFR